jgi:hypothetical protein
MNDIHIVTIILSVATTVFPVLFGFLLWKLSRIFISRTEFEDYKKEAETYRGDMKETVTRIETELHTVSINTGVLLMRSEHKHER